MRAFVFFTLVVLLGSCRKETAAPAAPAPPPSAVVPLPKAAPAELRIRVRNEGATVLQDVKVNFRGQVESFGDLQPGASSEYRKVAASFSYGLSEAKVGGTPMKLQPTDFFGEKLLPPGDYTWGLAPEGAESLKLVLTHD